ncbi:MAG: hypothetical protein ACOC43_13595 [Desulfohalobiaceae bacterium]
MPDLDQAYIRDRIADSLSIFHHHDLPDRAAAFQDGHRLRGAERQDPSQEFDILSSNEYLPLEEEL